MKKCITSEVQGARQKGRLRKTWKEVVGKDINDFHLTTEWCYASTGNCSDSNSDAVSWIWIVQCFIKITNQYLIAHNFTKCRLIFKILSPSETLFNIQPHLKHLLHDLLLKQISCLTRYLCNNIFGILFDIGIDMTKTWECHLNQYMLNNNNNNCTQLARCNPLFHFLNVLVPTGSVLVGQKNNNNKF